MTRPEPRAANNRRSRTAPRRVPFTFQCTCCECVELRPSPILPKGWVTVEFGADIQPYCAECAPEAEDEAQTELRFIERAHRIQAIAMPLLLVPASALGTFVVFDHIVRLVLRA